MADITDLLGLGAPGGGVFNIEPQQSPLASYLGASNIPTPEQPHHSKLRNTLGAIGDAMLVATGHAPIYRQRMEQEQQNQALQGFLQNPDEAIQRLMQVDPRAGVQLFTQMHSKQADPETIQLLKAAGIDPASDQGKQIIQSKLVGADHSAGPAFIQELVAAGIDPKSPEGIRLIYGHNSPAGYLLTPPSGAGGGSGGGGVPRINSQADYDALQPGARYMDGNGHVGVKGGATASTPSPTFR